MSLPVSSGVTMLRNVLPWVVTILLSVVAPIVTYDVAVDHGASEVLALILSGIGPLLEMAATAILRRRLDEFSLFILVLLAISTVTTLLFDDPRLLLLKESAVTGLFGLVLLGSLLAPRPMMFLFGRRFATNGDPERVAWWNGLWAIPGFRRMQRQLTTMWGVVLLAEAVVRAILTYRLPVATMVVVNAVVPMAVIAVLVVVTIMWGRRAQKAGEARAAAEASAAPAQPAQPAQGV